MVSKVKIGRNDPCPCGSGKKYKNCCAFLAEDDNLPLDPFDRYNQLMQTVKIKLEQYNSSQIRKIRKDSQNQFLHFTVDQVLPQEHQSFFSDWLWFDNSIFRGNTLAEIYLNNNGKFMDEQFKEILYQLSLSYFSVYEVLTVTVNSLKIMDIFTGKEHEVLLKIPLELGPDENMPLLFGRLVIMPNPIFSGMVLVAENNPEHKKFLREHVDYVTNLNQWEVKDLFKHKGEILYGFFTHLLKKTLVNLRDIRCTKISITESKLLDFYNTNPDYSLVHNTAGFLWFKPQRENRGYERIIIGNDHIIACADVLEDVAKLQEDIKPLLPEQEFTIISSRYLLSPPAEEYADLWFTVAKDMETERWLLTPHQELDGKTPAEVLNEDGGSLLLLNMLEKLTAQLNGLEKELLEYMKTRIKAYH